MFSNEAHHSAVQFHMIFFFSKAVYLVIFHYIWHVNVFCAKRFYHLIAFIYFHTWVFGTLYHKKWFFDTIDMKNRGNLFHDLFFIFNIRVIPNGF